MKWEFSYTLPGLELADVSYRNGVDQCRNAVSGPIASMLVPADTVGLAVLLLQESHTAWKPQAA